MTVVPSVGFRGLVGGVRRGGLVSRLSAATPTSSCYRSSSGEVVSAITMSDGPSPSPVPPTAVASSTGERSTTPPVAPVASSTGNTNTAVAAPGTAGSTVTTRPANSKKRGRETSPVPDALLQSALAQAAGICGNLGLLGLAGLLNGPSVHGVPKPDAVRAAAWKAYQEQPPWVHWNKTDMAAGFKVIGSHRLGLQGAFRGYRMARASAGMWVKKCSRPLLWFL